MSRGRSAEYIGFNIEFLQKLAKVGGMRYEMLDEGSWENAWHQLLEGHIDMIPAVFRTEEREKEVLFSNLPMGTLYVTLNVRVDDKRYGYEDFSSFQGMRVGIIRGSSDGERFQRYCEKFGVKPIIVPYAETQALLSALEDGTLDGVAITHLGRSSTFRSVAQFSPEPVYVAVAKNRPDLLARLDAAMNAIVLRDPNYMMRLYDKYFAVSMAQQPVFTKEEEAFLIGDGKGKPTGIFAATGGAENGATTTGAAITFDDVIELFYSLKSPYRKKAVWVLNEQTVKALRKIKDNTGNFIWQPSVSAGLPDTILNRPYVTSVYAPTIAAGAKAIAFGDYSYYWVADRQGRSLKRLNELFAMNGQVGFLASQRVDGKLILPEAVKTLTIKKA